MTTITNNSSNTLGFGTVTIAPGESASVEGFDAKHGVHSAWLESGAISTGKAKPSADDADDAKPAKKGGK